MFTICQIMPLDEASEQEWARDVDGVAEPDALSVHGVTVTKSRADEWCWHVGVHVMEHIRGVPLELELRQRLMAGLREVPDVVEVEEEDREMWVVNGAPSGRALVEAVASIVDELAPRCRAEMRSAAD